MVTGEAIKNLREAARVNQHTLAAELGVPPARLSEWENGKREYDEAFASRAREIICSLAAEQSAEFVAALREDHND